MRNDPPVMEPRTPSDEAFIVSTLARLDAAYEEKQLDHIRKALGPKTLRMRTVVMAVVAAAAVSMLATWAVMRVSAPEIPMAFGGAVVAPTPAGITHDHNGRIASIDGPEGQRLLFRGGRLVRVERLQNGGLDGMVVDFDARGYVANIRTWVGGVERGPWLELDESGRVRASGER